jgi:hypothetical protein
MHRAAGDRADSGVLGRQDLVACVPEFIRDDRGHVVPDPVTLGLQLPVLLVPKTLCVVGAAQAFTNRVPKDPVDGGVAPPSPRACPIPLIIQDPSDRPLASVCLEKLVDELPQRSLIRIDQELLVLPLIPKRSAATERLTESCADRHRGSDAGSNLLAFPLRHRRNHGVEQAASRRAGVYRLFERDEVSPVLSEEVRELKKLLRVSCKPSKLREDETRDLTGFDVGEHPLRLGMLHHRLSAYSLKSVDLSNIPTLRFRVVVGALLMVLGAIAARLIFRGNSDPNSDQLRRSHTFGVARHGYLQGPGGRRFYHSQNPGPQPRANRSPSYPHSHTNEPCRVNLSSPFGVYYDHMTQPGERESIWQRKWKWWQQVLVLGAMVAIANGFTSGAISTGLEVGLAIGAWLLLVAVIVLLNSRFAVRALTDSQTTTVKSENTKTPREREVPRWKQNASIAILLFLGAGSWLLVAPQLFEKEDSAQQTVASLYQVSLAENWQKVTTGDFVASMPVQPTVEHQTLNVPPVGDVSFSTYFAETEDESVGVFVSHYDFDLGTEHTRSRLVGAEEGLLSDTPNLVRTSSRWTTFQNREAREMEGTAGSLTARYLFFFEGQDLYALFMIDDSFELDLWNHFLNSFSIAS